jgi:hypothetical protein
MEGYWVRTPVKVESTKEQKRIIGPPSAPRWEVYIVARKGAENLLRILECKSYFEWVGVRASAFDGRNPEHAKRCKLFDNPELGREVFHRLCVQQTVSQS